MILGDLFPGGIFFAFQRLYNGTITFMESGICGTSCFSNLFICLFLYFKQLVRRLTFNVKKMLNYINFFRCHIYAPFLRNLFFRPAEEFANFLWSLKLLQPGNKIFILQDNSQILKHFKVKFILAFSTHNQEHKMNR